MVWNQRKMEFSIVYKAFSKLVGVGDAIDFIGETLFLCSGYCSKFDIVMTYLWFTLCCCSSFFCMLMNVLDCYLHDIDEVVVALVCWWIPYSSNTAIISATFWGSVLWRSVHHITRSSYFKTNWIFVQLCSFGDWNLHWLCDGPK